MDIKEAQDLLNKPLEENYVILSFGYSDSIIVPFKDGIQIVNVLAKADTIKNNYSAGYSVEPIKKDFEVKLISSSEYKEAKMRYYLQGEES